MVDDPPRGDPGGHFAIGIVIIAGALMILIEMAHLAIDVIAGMAPANIPSM